PMSRLKNRTPYELVKGVSPDVKVLQVWGCVCFAYVPEAVRKDKKLSARAIKSRFLGISEDTKRYRLLDVYNNKHFVARSVTFDTENCASIITRSFGTEPEQLTADELNEIDSLGRVRRNEPSIPKVPIDENKAQELSVGVKSTKRRLPVAVGAKRRSRRKVAAQDTTVERPKRDRTQTVRYGEYKCFQTHIDKTIAVDGIVKRISVPKSLREALSGPQRKQWQEALDLEYQSLLENGTWKLTKCTVAYWI
ncbi:Retrovirus-related Pol Polyprotein from transposon TNT 1-94, partial [Phytophthora megakarya]